MKANTYYSPPQKTVKLESGDIDVHKEGRNLLRQMAKQQGISFQDARKSIREVISIGMKSLEPSAIEFYYALCRVSVGSVPTPEEFMFYLNLKAVATSIQNHLPHSNSGSKSASINASLKNS